MSTRHEHRQGTLTRIVNGKTETYNVTLELEIRQLVSNGQVDDEAVAQIFLVGNARVPDGEYTLQYTFKGQPETLTGLQVKSGRFKAA
jgi:hypothetical protein